MILKPSFYQRDDVVQISKELLGKRIVTSFGRENTGGIIVETEAYRAPDDKACHAYMNRLTERTKTMFQKGGTLYVYISYGVHRMINVVTSTEGNAHAILIRAIEPTIGIDEMIERRGHEKLKLETVNGPGKSAKALGVDTIHDGLFLCNRSSGIWIEESDTIIKDEEIQIGPRVGMSIHTGPDAHRPWRFHIKGNRWVSNPKLAKYPEIPLNHS